MAAAGISQIRLGAKEGTALINGTAISAAIGVLALHDARQIVAVSMIALAMTVDGLRGFRDAFLPHINRLRSPRQAASAAEILRYLEESMLVRGAANIDLHPDEGPPQDPYSIRCAPAVLGAMFNTLDHIESVLTTELHAATDNPLVFAADRFQ